MWGVVTAVAFPGFQVMSVGTAPISRLADEDHLHQAPGLPGNLNRSGDGGNPMT
jgi:hypothetical protein